MLLWVSQSIETSRVPKWKNSLLKLQPFPLDSSTNLTQFQSKWRENSFCQIFYAFRKKIKGTLDASEFYFFHQLNWGTISIQKTAPIWNGHLAAFGRCVSPWEQQGNWDTAYFHSFLLALSSQSVRLLLAPAPEDLSVPKDYFACSRFYTRGITHHALLCVWHLSLGIIILRLAHVVCSYVLPSGFPLYGSTTFCPSVHLICLSSCFQVLILLCVHNAMCVSSLSGVIH